MTSKLSGEKRSRKSEHYERDLYLLPVKEEKNWAHKKIKSSANL